MPRDGSSGIVKIRSGIYKTDNLVRSWDARYRCRERLVSLTIIALGYRDRKSSDIYQKVKINERKLIHEGGRCTAVLKSEADKKCSTRTSHSENTFQTVRPSGFIIRQHLTQNTPEAIRERCSRSHARLQPPVNRAADKSRLSNNYKAICGEAILKARPNRESHRPVRCGNARR